MSGKLTEGFREIIELPWSDFVAFDTSDDATNFDSIIAGLVRACKKGNLRAIQTSLDRLDGKIAAEVEIEYPQFYTLYPNATKAADDPEIFDVDENGEIKGVIEGVTITGVNSIAVHDVTPSGAADLDELRAESADLPTGSLRVILEKMLRSPKQTVQQILDVADAVEDGVTEYGNPTVKSVIIAGLLRLVHQGRMSAIFEVLDQIDGKVADKVKLLGNDVYLTRYDSVAPAGAVKNADGVYQLTANNTTDTWAARLGLGKGGR